MPAQVTVTEKRISSQVRVLDGRLTEVYERHFKTRADEEFWRKEWELQAVLDRTLARRPIGIMQIKTACRAYTRGFIELCIDGKARGQRQASRAADQEGGEVSV